MANPIHVQNNETARRFEATVNAVTAFAEYRLHEGELVLPHTVVPPALEGQGVGKALAQAALGYAREQGLAVVPTCSFMAGFITRHPEYHDLVADSFRERLGID